MTPHLEIIAQMYPKSQKWRRDSYWHGRRPFRGHSCIRSVFNQWIKLSIHSSIDVPLWQLLIHVKQEDTRGLSIIRQLKVSTERKRWGEIRESLILDSCRMLNYPGATVHVKAEEESMTGSATVWEPDLVIPLQWQLINRDPLFLICCLWPTTITNSSVIAMTIMVPIHIILERRKRRRRRKDERRHLACRLVKSQTYTSASSCSAPLWYRQSVQSPY